MINPTDDTKDPFDKTRLEKKEKSFAERYGQRIPPTSPQHLTEEEVKRLLEIWLQTWKEVR